MRKNFSMSLSVSQISINEPTMASEPVHAAPKNVESGAIVKETLNITDSSENVDSLNELQIEEPEID